ncbi:hypothetical protein G7046_g9401 [Stylonectria norvegica]|nr:hypothetical protein G7046_g9401 [Stylonectria norvegica]
MAAVHQSPDAGVPQVAPLAVVLGSAPYDTPLSQQQTPPHNHHQHTPSQAQQRSVKRPRPVKSCTECRKRKLRCDRLCPCSQCQKSNRSCKYSIENDSSNLSDGSDGEMTESSRPMKRNCLPGMFTSGAPMANNDSGYGPLRNGESAGPLSLEDLSMRMERLEKHLMGGQSPAASEDSMGRLIAASSDTIRGLTVKEGASRTRYHGQNSSRVLLNLFDEAKDFMANHHNFPGVREVFINYKKLHKALQEQYRKSLSPITVFVDSMTPVRTRMTDILPKKMVCDSLIQSYFDTSETIYRILHMPTFNEQYNQYWKGNLQSDSFLPQLLAVLSIASRFETKSKGLGHERSEGVHIPTACALVRSWLDSLRGKRMIEFSTLQVEVLLVHAQRMIKPRAQESWTSLGSIVRMAMAMGLHRDSSEFEPRVPVCLGEMRRRLWFTILDMDLHISLACNLPCLVRDGDFTTRPPRNLDDIELYADMTELPPTKPIDQITDNQMQVYAAMTLGVRMKVAHLLNRIDTIRDYQEVLDVGAKLDRFLDDINYIFPRHGILSDAQKSKQWRSRVILDMHVRRPLLALYRPFAIGAPDAPAQISRAYLRSSMVILKYLDELDPMLNHFQDITDMYHQVLKKDIIQAALSICFFIRAVVRPASDTSGVGMQALRMSPDSSDDYPSYNPENLILWSPPRLIGTVEKTLELLIHNISGRDTKDVVCLAVVLQCVKTADPKPEDIVRELRAVLDGCLRSSNTSIDMGPPNLAPPAIGDGFQGDTYMNPHMSYLYQRNSMGMPAAVSDFDGWILWNGWD